MRNDVMYAEAIKNIQVHNAVATCQAKGLLVRQFGITKLTAAKAVDRLLNGTTNTKGERIAPLLKLADCKTRFVAVDAADWFAKRERFEVMAKAQEAGVLTHLSTVRHKRRLAELAKQTCEK